MNFFKCVGLSFHLVYLDFINIAFLGPASVERIANSSNRVVEGDPFVVACHPSGDPELIIYWIKEDNNQRINGSILNFTSINRNDSGAYRCEVKNDCASDSRVEIINVYCKYKDTQYCVQFCNLRNAQDPKLSCKPCEGVKD